MTTTDQHVPIVGTEMLTMMRNTLEHNARKLSMTFKRRPKDLSNRQRPPGRARRSTSAAASSKECKLRSTLALSHDSLTSMTRWDASTMAPMDNANNAAGQYPSQDSKPFRTPGCVWRVNRPRGGPSRSATPLIGLLHESSSVPESTLRRETAACLRSRDPWSPPRTPASGHDFCPRLQYRGHDAPRLFSFVAANG